jgi:hypothetical protein
MTIKNTNDDVTYPVYRLNGGSILIGGRANRQTKRNMNNIEPIEIRRWIYASENMKDGYIACECGHFKVIKAMFVRGQFDFRWMLNMTVSKGSPIDRLLICNSGTQPGRRRKLRSLLKWIISNVGDWVLHIKGCNGETALFTAWKLSCLDLVTIMLDKGADPTLACFNQDYSPSDEVMSIMKKACQWWHCPAEWRPTLHLQFPEETRAEIRTLLYIYHLSSAATEDSLPMYPQSGLHLIPVELFQYLMIWICTHTWQNESLDD